MEAAATPYVVTRVAPTRELTPLAPALLSPEELGRAEASGARADDFVAGAVLVRVVVGGCLGVDPERVPVERRCPRCGAAHGRPSLPGTGLTVSVTHSGGLVGVAVSDAPWVGIDLEPLGRVLPVDAARLVLTEAEVGLAADADGLLRLWTAKEAVLKAAGTGLAGELVRRTAVAALDPLCGTDLTVFGDPAGRLAALPLAPGYVGCLAATAGASWSHTAGVGG